MALGAALVVTAPAAAHAQGAAASAIVLVPDHDRLGDTLIGGSAHFSIPTPVPRLAIRLGAEHLRGHANWFGNPCGGFFIEQACPPERLRDNARLTNVMSGAAYRMIGTERLALAVTGDLSVGKVNSETRGLSSGAMISASRWLWGPRAGISTEWSPVPHVPLALEIGGAVGWLSPLPSAAVVDNYTPFETGFGIRHLNVGIAWRPRNTLTKE